jgi:hypothetical protein
MWTVIALLSPFAASAAELTDRVELPIAGAREDVAVLPAGEQGLVVLSSDRSQKGGTGWNFARYDTSFQRVWESSATLPGAFTRQDADTDGRRAVVAWLGNRRGEATVLVVDVATGAIDQRTVLLPTKALSIDQLRLSGDDLWIVGAGNREFLVHHDLASGTTTPMASAKRTFVDPVRIGPDGRAEIGMLTQKTGEMSLYPIEGATLGAPLTIGPDAERRVVLDAERRPVSDGTELVVGTYGQGGKRVWGAQGLYVAGLSGGALTFERHHSFSTFEDFFDYLPERKEERLERKAAKKQANGGDLRLDYRLLVHDVIERPDDLLLVAEAYVPEYHTYTITRTSTVNGVTTTTITTYTVFDGYRWTHAIVAALDRQGELLWDHAFPIEKVLSRRLRERVRVAAQPDGSVALVHLNKGELSTLVVRGAEVVAEGSTEVEAGPGAEVRRDWVGDAEQWYGDSFLAWGTEKVEVDDGKERVFWFARMTAAP